MQWNQFITTRTIMQSKPLAERQAYQATCNQEAQDAFYAQVATFNPEVQAIIHSCIEEEKGWLECDLGGGISVSALDVLSKIASHSGHQEHFLEGHPLGDIQAIADAHGRLLSDQSFCFAVTFLPTDSWTTDSWDMG